MSAPVEYDPFSAQILEDPHPVYRELRERSPVHYLERYDAWAFARFADVWAASEDAEHYSVEAGTTPAQLLTRTQAVTPMVGLQDPPRHTRIRSQIGGFFTPRSAARQEATVRRCVARCFDAHAGGALDVIQDLGLSISVRVALTLIGLPLEEIPAMLGFTERFFAREEGSQSITPDGLAAAGEMQARFEALVDERRRVGERRDDVLDALLHLEVDGKRLCDAEVTANLQLLVHGGTETLPKVLANTLVRLHESPDVRRRVAADPGLAPAAFREALRIDMPTQFLGRVVRKPVGVGGKRLEPGQGVLFLYASANRDADEFDAPDRYDIDRVAPRSLSFGHGVHACLGRNVALLEGRVALEEVLARAPHYELDLDAAVRLRTEFVQGFHSLPLRVGAA